MKKDIDPDRVCCLVLRITMTAKVGLRVAEARRSRGPGSSSERDGCSGLELSAEYRTDQHPAPSVTRLGAVVSLRYPSLAQIPSPSSAQNNLGT